MNLYSTLAQSTVQYINAGQTLCSEAKFGSGAKNIFLDSEIFSQSKFGSAKETCLAPVQIFVTRVYRANCSSLSTICILITTVCMLHH